MGWPVSSISRARLTGSSRAARKSAPEVATSPRATSGSPKGADVAATTRSQARTISRPPPSAGPSTAATSGVRRTRRMIPYSPPRSVTLSPAAVMSLPALKTPASRSARRPRGRGRRRVGSGRRRARRPSAGRPRCAWPLVAWPATRRDPAAPRHHRSVSSRRKTSEPGPGCGRLGSPKGATEDGEGTTRGSDDGSDGRRADPRGGGPHVRARGRRRRSPTTAPR